MGGGLAECRRESRVRRRHARNLTRQAIALFAAVLVAACVLGSPAGGDAANPDWLQLINSIRVANGLQPVTVNETWAAGIRLHLQYLADTPAQYRTGAYVSAHTENPASPYYTAAGAEAGGASDLGGGATDIAAIDGWLSAPFHTVGILRPGLQTVGFYRDPGTSAAGLNIISGLTGDDTHTGPIMYPAPGATTDIPAPTGGESPNPLETCGWQSSGLPIILLLPNDPTADISAQLTRPDGSTIGTPGPDLCLVTKDTYTTTDPVYGPTGASILAGDHAVFVIPHTWLKPGSYTMRVAQSGQPDVVWSFTSAPAPVGLSLGDVSRTDCGSASGTGYVSTSMDVADDWASLDQGSRAFERDRRHGRGARILARRVRTELRRRRRDGPGPDVESRGLDDDRDVARRRVFGVARHRKCAAPRLPRPFQPRSMRRGPTEPLPPATP